MDSEKITKENCRNYNLRQFLNQNENCFAVSLTKYKRPIYQKGHFYWCNYWAKAYEVLEVKKEKIKSDNGYIFTRLISVKVKWLEDGKIATHCTTLDQRDYELIFS